MADPLSIVTGVIGLGQTCLCLVSYIRSLNQDLKDISPQLVAIHNEIEMLRKLCKTLEQAVTPSPSMPPRAHDMGELAGEQVANTHYQSLWIFLDGCVTECGRLLASMHSILRREFPEGAVLPTSRKLAKLKAVFAKRSIDAELINIRRHLGTQQGILNTILSLMAVQDGRLAHVSNLQSLANIANDVHCLRRRVESQMQLGGTVTRERPNSRGDMDALAALDHLDTWFNSMPEKTPLRIANEHFDIPQTVSSFYVGRGKLLDELRDALIQPPGPSHTHRQRRFVIHGIGGSGKTQFCCKFAEENRESFWGVFYLDGSSKIQLEQSLGRINRLLGLENASATESSAKAALYRLSTEHRRWLLIIDNADDPDLPLENYFPKGNRGHVVITTRVPGHSIYNHNVELEPYDFSSQLLSPDEAADLLLRAARRPLPGQAAWRDIAYTITETLGYLSLAICLAGAAIRKNECNLHTFQDFYDLSLQQLQDYDHAVDDLESRHEICVITTWDGLYQRLQTENTQLSRDAIQLLNVFAFLHRENIPQQLFERALTNADLEAVQATRDREQEKSEAQPRDASYLDWLSQKQRDWCLWLLRAQAPLPDVIREGRKPDNARMTLLRVTKALSELTQRSLIDYNEISQSYTMHPIVHRWAGKRHRLNQQALWADMAGIVLSASILLPPLGSGVEDDAYHLSLLPHVEQVQGHRAAIAEKMMLKGALSWRARFRRLDETHYEMKLLMFGKFSLVYMRCGHFAEAERLLTVVVGALNRVLGPQSSRTRRAILALSEAHWQNSRPQRASELQESLLRECQRLLGPEHPDTLRTMSKLGNTRWQQGRLSEALALQRSAVEGLQKHLGERHPDTLTAIDQLGRTVMKFYRRANIEESYQLHRTAMEGLRELYGDDHRDTLEAKESFSRAALLIGEEHAVEAERIMADVLERRRARLGKANPGTLLAMVNMAIAKCAIRQPQDGEVLIREGLEIADKMYGTSHIATAWGRSILAVTLIHQRRFDEAESLLREVSMTQKSMAARRGNYHPDRLATLIELARCYQLRGKTAQSIETCDEAIRGLQDISKPGTVHALAELLQHARTAMSEHLKQGSSDLLSGYELPRIVFPAIHFYLSD